MPLFQQSRQLQQISRQCRLDLLDMIYQSGQGHFGGPLSSIDILTALYFSKLFNFKKDKFILSAGHLASALYVVLANANYFDKSKLKTFSSFDSFLQGHVSTQVPGVEYSSGSLGQGLSFAAGLALGDRTKKIITLTSDGEHQEGQIWETLAFAKKYNLSNLINIIDLNGYQIDGSTKDIMPLGNLAAKYIQFGWTVTTIDGHNFKQILKTLEKAKQSDYPNCIIAQTTFAKGIPSIENDYHYHDVKNLSENIYQKFKQQL
jgi:transketolase